MPKKTPIPPEILAQLGVTWILSSRNGVPYVKRYTRPRNPRTAAQRRTRTALARAVHAWQASDPQEKARWNEAARGTPQSGYTLFLREFIGRDGAIPG